MSDECYFCPSKMEHEHHIIPQRFDGPDSEDNLVPVCSDCHTKLENMYDESFYRWFGVEDEIERRWRYKPCTFQDCDEQPDRLIVLSGSVVDEHGSAKATPPSLHQPVCDDCLRQSVRSMNKHLNQPTDEEAIDEEVERRTVES